MLKRAIFFILTAIALETLASPVDSVGTKVKNGKVYIIHEVEKGQGLFSISRRYSVHLAQIVENNPGSDKHIYPGQILFIPTGKNAPFEEKVVKDYFSHEKGYPAPDKPTIDQAADKKAEQKTTFAKYHTVEEGETLYAISRKYGTTVEVLKELNQLKEESLSLGQKLLVPNSNDQEKISSDPANKAEHVPSKDSPQPERLPAKDGKAKITPVKTDRYIKRVEKIAEFDIEKITEKGFASILNAETADPTKNYCHHHEAEPGTVIMVTNPANGRSVFVKVLSRAEFNQEEAIVVYLSEAAAKSIGIDKDKSLIELNYAR